MLRVGFDWHHGESGRRSEVFSHLLLYKNRVQGKRKWWGCEAVTRQRGGHEVCRWGGGIRYFSVWGLLLCWEQVYDTLLVVTWMAVTYGHGISVSFLNLTWKRYNQRQESKYILTHCQISLWVTETLDVMQTADMPSFAILSCARTEGHCKAVWAIWGLKKWEKKSNCCLMFHRKQSYGAPEVLQGEFFLII